MNDPAALRDQLAAERARREAAEAENARLQAQIEQYAEDLGSLYQERHGRGRGGLSAELSSTRAELVDESARRELLGDLYRQRAAEARNLSDQLVEYGRDLARSYRARRAADPSLWQRLQGPLLLLGMLGTVAGGFLVAPPAAQPAVGGPTVVVITGTPDGQVRLVSSDGPGGTPLPPAVMAATAAAGALGPSATPPSATTAAATAVATAAPPTPGRTPAPPSPTVAALQPELRLTVTALAGTVVAAATQATVSAATATAFARGFATPSSAAAAGTATATPTATATRTATPTAPPGATAPPAASPSPAEPPSFAEATSVAATATAFAEGHAEVVGTATAFALTMTVPTATPTATPTPTPAPLGLGAPMLIGHLERCAWEVPVAALSPGDAYVVDFASTNEAGVSALWTFAAGEVELRTREEGGPGQLVTRGGDGTSGPGDLLAPTVPPGQYRLWLRVVGETTAGPSVVALFYDDMALCSPPEGTLQRAPEPVAATASIEPPRPYVNCRPYVRTAHGYLQLQPKVWLDRPRQIEGSWPITVRVTGPDTDETVSFVAGAGRRAQRIKLPQLGWYKLETSAVDADLDENCNKVFEYWRTVPAMPTLPAPTEEPAPDWPVGG